MRAHPGYLAKNSDFSVDKREREREKVRTGRSDKIEVEGTRPPAAQHTLAWLRLCRLLDEAGDDMHMYDGIRVTSLEGTTHAGTAGSAIATTRSVVRSRQGRRRSTTPVIRGSRTRARGVSAVLAAAMPWLGVLWALSAASAAESSDGPQVIPSHGGSPSVVFPIANGSCGWRLERTRIDAMRARRPRGGGLLWGRLHSLASAADTS